MTNVIFYKNNDNFIKVEVKGHTGFGVHGSDIVCSAISSIAQVGALGLQKVLGLNPNIVVDDKAGYLSYELHKDLEETKMQEAQIIIKTVFEGIKDLQSGYSKYIKLEVK